MEDICMKDCHFNIDEKNRTVVCWKDGCKYMFMRFLSDNFPLYDRFCYYGFNLEMNDRFVGKAVCAEGDTFDVETGKQIAYYRMRRKLQDSFYNHIKQFFDVSEKALDNFETTCIGYRDKVEQNLEKHSQVLFKSL